MVMRYVLIGLFSLLSNLIIAAEVEINVSVDSDRALENKPLIGIITVSRTSDEKIDLHTFRCDGKELEVQFLHDAVESSLSVINGVRQEKKRLISTYRFLLPEVKAGKHLLQPITVEVGGHLYTSKPIAYVVYGTETSKLFSLEAFVTGGSPIYPGQRMQFIYRVACRKQIEACYEELPLLQADQFRKLGERKSNCEFRDGWVVQELKQEVQAIGPGEYHFGKSCIEGIPFQRDFFGNRVYEKVRLRAEASQMVVVVEPFPEKDKPSSFQGALGSFRIETQLLTPAELVVGDKLRLIVTITGTGEWSTVMAPELSLQSNFKELFRISDLPAIVENGDHYKRFTIEMRPLSASLTAIPPIEFSFFEPSLQRYQTVHSSPTPLLVKAALSTAEQKEDTNARPQSELTAQSTWRNEWQKPHISRINGPIPLTEQEVQKKPLRNYLMLYVSVLVLGLGLQWMMKKSSWWRRYTHQKPSHSYLVKMRVRHKEGKSFFSEAEQALVLALLEEGLINQTPSKPEELPSAGVIGKVKVFLMELEALHFAQGVHTEAKESLILAEQLYADIVRRK